tara:strand:+ start:258 stop:686 length:429 start_codon:yes stop_codon:yes gene_type:complete
MPYDSETGKHYDYTKEGIDQYKKDTGNEPMKNMDYWKAKHQLSGINHVSDGNLEDGRSLSAPFQAKETASYKAGGEGRKTTSSKFEGVGKKAVYSGGKDTLPVNPKSSVGEKKKIKVKGEGKAKGKGKKIEGSLKKYLSSDK